MSTGKAKAALAAMRRASAHHLLSSAEQAKLLAVAEAWALLDETRRKHGMMHGATTAAWRDLDAAFAALGEP